MRSSAAGLATFERLSGAFRAACEARPDEVIERDYRIAGRPVMPLSLAISARNSATACFSDLPP